MQLRRVLGRTNLLLLATFAIVAATSLFWLSTVRAADPGPIQLPPNQGPELLYSYAVKVVCSTDGSIDFDGGGFFLGRTGSALADADMYQTAVNIFNPGEERAEINTRISLAHAPFESPVRETVMSGVPVEREDTVEFDCEAFDSSVSEDAVAAGGSGFFIIYSRKELEVVAVYTVLEKSGCVGDGPVGAVRRIVSGQCKGAGTSIDVEYIEPRVIQLQEDLPDLTVRLINPSAVVNCVSGSCETTIEYEVTNVSFVDVFSNFEVRLEVDGLADTGHHVIPGLLAGESVAFKDTLEGNCYIPNCEMMVVVDEPNEVAESDETNNRDTRTDVGVN